MENNSKNKVMKKSKGSPNSARPFGKSAVDKIEINPKLSTDTVSEQAGSAVVLTFGRLNPITTGHEKLVNAVKELASSKNAKPLIYLSHSQDAKKNPLSYEEKLSLAKKAFGPIVKESSAKTILDVAKELQNTFKNLYVVVGSDRVSEFNTLLNKYNGKDYKFDSIKVVSAGERDPDSDDVSGMSASKLRKLVAQGDFEAFKSGLPSQLRASAKSIFDLLRKKMNLKEQLISELREEGLLDEAVLNLQQRLKRKMLMRKFKVKIKRAREISRRRFARPEQIKKRAQIAARKVIRKRVAGQRGVNYQNLSPSDKIQVDKMVEKKKNLIKSLARRFIPIVKKKEVQRLQSFRAGQAMKHQHSGPKPTAESIEEAKVPQDRMIGKREGSQPAAYHKGLDKETKERRDAQFKRQTDMPASQSKPAPGDLDKSGEFKKTELSKHTKKYREMYGEAEDQKDTADFKIVIGSDGKERKVRAHKVTFQKEEDNMLKFREMVEEIKRGRGRPPKPETLAKRAELAKKQAAKKASGKYDPADDDDAGLDPDNKREPDQNILFQLQKAITLDGKMTVNFDNGPSFKVKPASAEKAIRKYMSLQKPAEKLDFLKKLSHSHADFKKIIGEEVETDTKDLITIIEKVMDRIEEYEALNEKTLEGLKKKAEKSGIPYGVLKKVYDRGLAAWRTGHRPGANPQQWAFARVNSFITKGKGTWGGADKDLAAKVK